MQLLIFSTTTKTNQQYKNYFGASQPFDRSIRCDKQLNNSVSFSILIDKRKKNVFYQAFLMVKTTRICYVLSIVWKQTASNFSDVFCEQKVFVHNKSNICGLIKTRQRIVNVNPYPMRALKVSNTI